MSTKQLFLITFQTKCSPHGGARFEPFVTTEMRVISSSPVAYMAKMEHAHGFAQADEAHEAFRTIHGREPERADGGAYHDRYDESVLLCVVPTTVAEVAEALRQGNLELDVDPEIEAMLGQEAT